MALANSDGVPFTLIDVDHVVEQALPQHRSPRTEARIPELRRLLKEYGQLYHLVEHQAPRPVDKELIASFWSANGPENGRRCRPRWSSRRMPRDRLSKLRSQIGRLGGDYRLMEAAANASRQMQGAPSTPNNVEATLPPPPVAAAPSFKPGPATGPAAAAAAYPQLPVQSHLPGVILDPALMQFGHGGGLGDSSVPDTPAAPAAVADNGNSTGLYWTEDRLAQALRGELNNNNNLWSGVEAEQQLQHQLPLQRQQPPMPERSANDFAMVIRESAGNNHHVGGANTLSIDSNALPTIEEEDSAALNSEETETEAAEDEPVWGPMGLGQLAPEGFEWP